MKIVTIYTAICICIPSFLFPGVIQGESVSNRVILQNEKWRIEVVPETFEVFVFPKNKEKFVASAAQSHLTRVINVEKKQNRLDWVYQKAKIRVSISLTGADLFVKITAQDPGEFNFPIINQSENLKALILPHWQGMYVPLDNERWREVLARNEFDTLEGLTMPFFGLDMGDYTLTYIITNRFNNKMTFKKTTSTLQSNFSHTFTRNRKVKEYGVIIKLSDTLSPIEPARAFRAYLKEMGRFVTMEEKAKSVPNVNRLLGAVHAYLWGELQMTFDDVYQRQWKSLCNDIVKQAASGIPTPGKRIFEMMNPKDWEELEKLPTLKYPYIYIKAVVASGISKVLINPDFYQKKYFVDVKVPKEYIALSLQKTPLTQAQIFRKNSLLFHAAYPKKIRPPDEWGYGYSVRMLNELKAAGIDKARLVHDLWEFGMMDYLPQVAIEADRMGYLLGPYDSFNSIHDPKYWGTDHSWSTAQFDNELFKTGIIVTQNGKQKAGFMGRGGRLSPIAARPWVEKRVRRIMNNTPYNAYFIDCDAWGEVFDDYSPDHPATQEDDAKERTDRMKWIRDTYKVVIGSEGGSSYAAPVIHVAEGMMSTAFGKWKDPDFGNKQSEYFLGRWYPQHGPEIFLKQVPLKEAFVFFHYDPKFRLPLNEIVFHDSFVSTNHYSSAHLKFKNIQDDVELTSLLYLVPPMYHLNIEAFRKKKAAIKRHFDFFSPLHRKMGFSQMTDFKWLSDDHLVQKTTFGEDLEMVANFNDRRFDYQGIIIPGKSILAKWIRKGESIIYEAVPSK